MAYGTKYFANYYYKTNPANRYYKIELQKNGYSDAETEIEVLGPEPLVHSIPGGAGDMDHIIKGSEMRFSFFAAS